MAKITFRSDDVYIKDLQLLGKSTVANIKEAVYPAAGIVADAIKKSIDTIPTLKKGEWGTTEHPIDGLLEEQKEGLRDGLGISSFSNDDGFINVRTSFAGYNSLTYGKAVRRKWTTTKQANVMIARSVEGGTSFRKKRPFVAQAVRKTKKQAIEQMRDGIDEIMKRDHPDLIREKKGG